VVVPAHNEQQLLPACLAALRTAATSVDTQLDIELIVVADSCDDATATIAEHAGAHVVPVDVRSVGRARVIGMDFALRRGTDGLWLATTDADSRVPRDWLAWQRRHALDGADLLVGAVTVTDWTPRPTHVRELFEAQYRRRVVGAVHGHVHGANLGVAAAAYRRLGGFAPLPHSEDHDLLARARRAGLRIVADATCPVDTSARRRSRAPNGFAAYLDTLTRH